MWVSMGFSRAWFFLSVLSFSPIASGEAAHLLAAEARADVTSMDLSGDWSFAYTSEAREKPPGEQAFLATMPVPGAWDDTVNQAKAAELWPGAKFNPRYKPIQFPYASKPPDASLPFLQGTGWYRKALDVPASWRGRMVTLRVGQVVTDATLFINGLAVHTHKGHNTEWEAPVADALRYGEVNDLVIAVSNTRNGGGCRLRGWAGLTGGIFAPVSLKVSGGPARVESLYVYQQPSGGLRWNVAIEGAPPAGSELRWRVLEAGETVLEGVTAVTGDSVSWDTTSQGLQPWSDRSPKLYQIQVALLSAGKPIDETRQSFGLRRLVADGRTLKLNGTPVYLRGHCEHYYFPETCTPALDKETYLKQIAKLKGLGFNWLRFHTWMPTKVYMQAADELGMLISIEGQDGMTLDMWRDMVRAGRVHPSVVIYTPGNEQVFDEESLVGIGRMAKEQKLLAPDGLFSPNSGERGIIRSTKESGGQGGFGESFSETPVPHSPARLALVNQFSDLYQPHIWGLLSYSSLKGEWRDIDRRLQIFTKPALVHESGIVGSFIDLSLRDRYVNTRIRTSLFDEARDHMRAHGVLDRAPLYYKNSVAAQELIRKDMMEMTRLCQSLGGYELLGAVDMHWHRTGYDVGIMNEFFELKPGITTADVLSYNGESVLLIDDQRERVLSVGDKVERELKVSWYGSKPLDKGRLAWSLTNGDTVVESGGWFTGLVQTGSVSSIGQIKFNAPALARPAKLRLKVSLADASGSIANEWEFWVFPPAPETPGSPRVLVTDKLDATALEKLASGGRVVLLGGQSLPRRALSFQQGIGGRPENNFATAIYKHPIIDGFPHDGYFDWQFFRMCNKATSVVFDGIPVDFQPVIEVVNSYKQIIRQGALFEWQVGRGRLIVCTLNLEARNPAAAYLRSLILGYAAGPELAVAPSLAPAEIAKLAADSDKGVRKLSVDDEGFDPRSVIKN